MTEFIPRKIAKSYNKYLNKYDEKKDSFILEINRKIKREHQFNLLNDIQFCEKHDDGFETTKFYKNSKKNCDDYAIMLVRAGYDVEKNRTKDYGNDISYVSYTIKLRNNN